MKQNPILAWSLHRKILVFLLILFLPGFAVLVVRSVNERNDEIRKAQNNAVLVTESLAAQQVQLSVTARMLLTMLAQTDEVQTLSPEQCNRLFAVTQQRHPDFATIMAARPDGRVFAASKPLTNAVSVANSKEFQDALRTHDFSVGEYEPGALGENIGLAFAYPVLDDAGRLTAIVLAGVSANHYQSFVSELNLPKGYAVLFADSKGARLFRWPVDPAMPIGRRMSPAGFSVISGAQLHGFRTWTADGTTRIYAFRQIRLREDQSPYLYVLAGIPKTEILDQANREVAKNLAALLLAMVGAVLLAWRFGKISFTNPIARLVEATNEFGAGNMSVRTGLSHYPDEIGQLAKSFDAMAALLERKRADQDALEEALRNANSELKRHQEQLEHEVVRRTLELRRIVDTAQEGIWALDLDASITYANSRMAEILGCAAEAMLGRSFYEFVHESARESLIEKMKKHREGVSEQYECRFRGKKAEDIWVRISASPLTDGCANLIGTLALVTDITFQVTAQRQLRLQSAALTAAANAIVIADCAGVILWVNPAFSELTGYSQSEVVGQNTRILNSGKQNPVVYQKLWDTILSGSVWRGELINRRKNGSLYVEETTITPVRSDSGEITHFISIKVDISERHHAQQALAHSAANLRSLVLNSPFGVFRSTLEGRILNANPALCTMLGYGSEAELMSIDINNLYHKPEARARVLEKLSKDGQLNDLETRWSKKDGYVIDVRIDLHTCNDASGMTVFEGFVEDITERKRSHQELHRLNRALTTLSRCNEGVVHAADEADLVKRICDILVQVGGYRLAWVGYAEQDETRSVRSVARSGVDDCSIEEVNISWADCDRGCGPTGNAIRTGELSVLRNVAQDAQFARRDSALQRGYASIIALPLREGPRSFGALTIYASEPDAFDGQEIKLLEELAADLAFGISSLRNEATRKKAEVELRDSEQRYRLLFARNPHPMWLCDLETHAFLEVNDAALSRYGYSREEFLAMTIDDIRPVEDIPALLEVLATAKEGYTFSGSSRHRHRTKDGSIIQVEIAAYRFLHEGRMLSLILANDVTERTRAEQALAKSEQRYRALFEHNLAAVFHSSHGKLLDCNEAMCQMLGYSRAELLALDVRTLYCDLAAREAGQRQLYSGGKLVNYQIDLRRKDDSVITVLANLNLLEEDTGPPTVAGVMLDITETRKLQEQLLQSRKLEAIGKFSGGIAHDFNNILMIINSYSEIMLGKLPADDRLRRPAEQIRGAVDRAAALTKQLLAFSRKQATAPVPLRLDWVLRELQEMMKRLIGEDILLEVVGTEGLWLTMVDPSQIEQVILNMAANARDAMPHGGRLTLRSANVMLDSEFAKIHSGRAGEYVALSISDTGCGIDPGIQARIFEPFFTTKAPGKGTGLGLSTVYGIVKQSNGYITVESEPGAGTTFSIYFPRTIETESFEIRSRDTSSTPSAATILLVEDEDPTREAIAEYLQEHSFQVVSAANAQEALRIAKLSAPDGFDVLLTDVVMPGMKGSELAMEFRQEFPNGRVVFMSGYTDEVLTRSGLDLQSITLIAKPFRLQDLVTKLRGLVAAAMDPSPSGSS